MTPNHDLFRKIFAISDARVDTYDYLPEADTKYPFVYVGENNGSDTPNNDLIGTARQTSPYLRNTSAESQNRQYFSLS